MRSASVAARLSTQPIPRPGHLGLLLGHPIPRPGLLGLLLGHPVPLIGGRGLLASSANLQLSPDTSALPGGNVLQHLMNGLDGWALALSLVGLVVGAAAWALGSHGQNYQQSFVGRRAVLISGLAALLIGAGPGIVNFFFNTGQGVH
ncbi:MAG: DUF6112 family protein [Acidimicrobiales bacterium]|jgi:hypothetical protein